VAVWVLLRLIFNSAYTRQENTRGYRWKKLQ
jgi:hypothetical protein